MILVTPAALDSVAIGDRPLMLARELVTSWEKMWSAPVRQFTQEGGSTRVWTRKNRRRPPTAPGC